MFFCARRAPYYEDVRQYIFRNAERLFDFSLSSFCFLDSLPAVKMYQWTGLRWAALSDKNVRNTKVREPLSQVRPRKRVPAYRRSSRYPFSTKKPPEEQTTFNAASSSHSRKIEPSCIISGKRLFCNVIKSTSILLVSLLRLQNIFNNIMSSPGGSCKAWETMTLVISAHVQPQAAGRL